MNRTGLLSLLAVSTAMTAFACSKDPPPATQPQAQAYNGQYPAQQGYPQQQGYPAGAQTGAPQQGYPAGTPTSAPNAAPTAAPTAAPASGATGTAQAIDPNLAAAASGPLGLWASSEAPGMTKEGAPIAGNFQAGQTLEQAFTFQPGKCYTVIAQGVGISELDLEMQYVTPLPGLNPSIGKDAQKGAQASIGGKGNCLKPLSPFPTNAKFIVKATTGAGVAAAQLYSK